MNNLILKNFKYVMYLLFAFPLFKVNIINLLVIVLIILSLIINPKKINSIYNLNFFSFTIPFWIVLFTSLFYFGEKNWYNNINNAIPFLIYPFAFFLIPIENFNSDDIKKYLRITKLSCLIIFFTFIITFIYKYSIEDFFVIEYQISKFRDFVYNDSSVFKIHPTYYTLIILFLITNSFEILIKKRNVFEIVFTALSILIIFLLLSKVTITLTILLLFYYLVNRIRLSHFKKISLSFFLFFLISFLLIKTPGVLERFKEIYLSFNNPPEGVQHDSTNIRIALYKCDIEILKENYLLGIGFHNVKQEILSCLETNYEATFYNNHLFLTHNYFLYIIIGSGIFGFFIFMLYIYKLFLIALKIKKIEFYFFILLIFIASLTEDFLYRNLGNFFFHIFFFTYYLNYKLNVPNNVE